jgi:hypothetical protein
MAMAWPATGLLEEMNDVATKNGAMKRVLLSTIIGNLGGP